MKIEIKNRWTGSVLFSCEADSMKLAVKLAIGASVNLCDADLCDADLCGADLRYADLRGANLCGADLRYADLRGANLRGADLDYSCWPLWCGSNNVKVDVKVAAQLAAHFCAVECDDPAYKKARKAILKFALTSHRAADLGIAKGGK